MPSLFKAIKATKRRVCQNIKVKMGQSDVTTDAGFDIELRRYEEMEKNLLVLRSQCEKLVDNIDTWSDTNRNLAIELQRFAGSGSPPGGAGGAGGGIGDEADDLACYRNVVDGLHEALTSEYEAARRAITTILRHRIMQRVDTLAREDFAEVRRVVRNRAKIVTDYDSHRERTALHERRGELAKADKFRHKCEHDQQQLEEHTHYLRTRFGQLLAIGSQLLSRETTTLVTCEMVLVRKQYEALSRMIGAMGEDAVADREAEIEDLVERVLDGETIEMGYHADDDLPAFEPIEPPVMRDFNPAELVYRPPSLKSSYAESTVAVLPPPERTPTGRQLGAPIGAPMGAPGIPTGMPPPLRSASSTRSAYGDQASPCAVMSMRTAVSSTTTTTTTSTTAATATGGGRGDGGKSGHNVGMLRTGGVSLTPAAADSLPEAAGGGRFVVAVYSLAAGEDGELSFKQGDRIEVLREDDSGWWEGQLRGEVGLFPENYTRPL